MDRRRDTDFSPGTEPGPGWLVKMADELCKMDAEQAPQGLYGLPVRGLAEIFAGGQAATSIPKRLGWETSRGRAIPAGDMELRTPEGEVIVIWLGSYASTRVKKFGNRYMLERVQNRDEAADCPALENRVTDLRKGRQAGGWHCLLFIAHVRQDSGLQRLLGRSGSPEFLEKHGLHFCRREGEDRHGRGFFTAVWAWAVPAAGEG